MLHMASKHYIPAVIRYTTELASSINAVKSACPVADVSVQQELLGRVSALLRTASTAHDSLSRLTEQARANSDAETAARAFRTRVVPVMEQLRSAVDELELLVNKDYWPVPTYGDLMFEV